VEAGLRSRDLGDVEEINRILIDARSSLLLCNSREAFSNLVGEGYPAERCVISGNTVVAALAILMKRISAPAVDVGATRYALASFHRKETLSSRERCTAILDGLRDVAKLLPIQFILYESTEDALREKGLLSRLSEIPNMTVARTQPFRDYLNLLGSAVLVITDSSGTLDEARALGKPVVILRQSTHRIHVADSVFTRLSGHDAWRIQSAAAELLDLSVQQPAASKLFDTSDQVISSLVDAFKQLSLSLPEESE
jgi:UDP-N-acetylglucosamine 2-epimerase (non-hydrolysing)